MKSKNKETKLLSPQPPFNPTHTELSTPPKTRIPIAFSAKHYTCVQNHMQNRITLLLLSLLQLNAWSAPNFTGRATGTTFTASNFAWLAPSTSGPNLVGSALYPSNTGPVLHAIGHYGADA